MPFTSLAFQTQLILNRLRNRALLDDAQREQQQHQGHGQNDHPEKGEEANPEQERHRVVETLHNERTPERRVHGEGRE
jgi:hypothetical protein